MPSINRVFNTAAGECQSQNAVYGAIPATTCLTRHALVLSGRCFPRFHLLTSAGIILAELRRSTLRLCSNLCSAADSNQVETGGFAA